MSVLTNAHILPRSLVSCLGACVPTALDGARGVLTPDRVDSRARSWASQMLRIADVTVVTEGIRHLDPSRIYVVMSNHQSLYDIPVLYVALPLRLRMVAKTELFQIPIWGQALRSAGFVEVDRGDRTRAIESLRKAKATLLEQGVSVWIAPEGTRSDSGKLGPFKQGGFHLAIEAGVSILPVGLSGTREVLGARSWHVNAGRKVRVAIGEPIDPTQYGESRRFELVEKVKDAILRLKGESPLP